MVAGNPSSDSRFADSFEAVTSSRSDRASTDVGAKLRTATTIGRYNVPGRYMESNSKLPHGQ